MEAHLAGPSPNFDESDICSRLFPWIHLYSYGRRVSLRDKALDSEIKLSISNLHDAMELVLNRVVKYILETHCAPQNVCKVLTRMYITLVGFNVFLIIKKIGIINQFLLFPDYILHNLKLYRII